MKRGTISPSFRIKLFGEPAILSPGGKSQPFLKGHNGIVLARLALGLGKFISREELIRLAWPTNWEQTPPNRLSVALYSIRTQLAGGKMDSGPLIESGRGWARLNPAQFSCDAVEFEDAISPAIAPGGPDSLAKAQTALQLYQGRLGAGQKWTWLEVDREARRDQVIRCLQIVMEAHPNDSDQLLSLARRDTAITPRFTQLLESLRGTWTDSALLDCAEALCLASSGPSPARLGRLPEFMSSLRPIKKQLWCCLSVVNSAPGMVRARCAIKGGISSASAGVFLFPEPESAQQAAESILADAPESKIYGWIDCLAPQDPIKPFRQRQGLEQSEGSIHWDAFSANLLGAGSDRALVDATVLGRRRGARKK